MCYKLSLGVKLTLVALFLFLQSFSQNVGIGTTNPIEKLQVAGNLHVDGNVRAQGRYYYFGAKQFLHGDNSSVLQFRSANPLYTQFHFRDSTGRFYGKLLGYNGGDIFGIYDANNKPFFQSKLDTYLRFLVGNSEKVRIETTGDVGIGTTNPLYRLDIFDPGQAMLRLRSSSDHTILQLRTVAAKGNYLRFNRDGNSSFWLYNTPTNDLQFRPLGGTASVIFKENGFVGIGTTSPTNMLDVNGAARVRTLTAGNAADQVVVADANGVLRKLPASGLGLEDHDWYGVGTTAAPTSINDNIFTQGDVGIGIANPLEKLHVQGNMRLDGRVIYFGGTQRIIGDDFSGLYYDANHSTVTQMIFRDKEYTRYGAVTGSGNGVRFGLLDGDANWAIRLEKDLWTGFNINNVEKMRILDNGNVGIGTSTPANSIHTIGNIRADGRKYYFGATQNLTGDDGSAIAFNGNHSTISQFKVRDKEGKLYGILYGSGDGVRFGLLDGDGNWSYRAEKDLWTGFNINNSEKMRILANGHVGIGTMTPESRLHVKNTGTSLLKVESTTNSTILEMETVSGKANSFRFLRNGAASFYINNTNANDLHFRPLGNATPSVSFTANGRVGVGKTAPATSIHTAGNIRADGRKYYFGASQYMVGDNSSASAFYGNHSTISQFKIRDKEGTLYGVLYGDANGANFGLLDGDGQWSYRVQKDVSTRFLINNSEKMRILANGNVGIGITNPTNRLEVNGVARIKEVIITVANWPDYVFDASYDLPTLSEEANYIEENGHLSGFESEADMEGKMTVGDVTKRQQEKIEQMMLHLIEMNEKMEQKEEAMTKKMEQRDQEMDALLNKVNSMQQEIDQLQRENEQLKGE